MVVVRVYMSPQVSDKTIAYEFEGDTVTATMEDISDTFDFSGTSDGRIDLSTIQTLLPVNPILEAERIDGVLHLKLLNFIQENAPEADRFPEWKDV
jgi:hypothetical protein